jgi:hypothetical protein
MTSIGNTEFNAQEVRELLAELGRRLAASNLHAEVFIVGGAAMALVYDVARTTADIDAILKPRDLLLDKAATMAVELTLPEHWLSDAVSQMMPPIADDNPRAVAGFDGLSVSIASPEYLLAMKAMVSRKSPSDLADAAVLCTRLGIYTEPQLEDIVHRYFGRSTLGAQELWLEDIVERATESDAADPKS